MRKEFTHEHSGYTIRTSACKILNLQIYSHTSQKVFVIKVRITSLTSTNSNNLYSFTGIVVLPNIKTFNVHGIIKEEGRGNIFGTYEFWNIVCEQKAKL